MGKRTAGSGEQAIRVLSGTFAAAGQSGNLGAVGMTRRDQFSTAEKDDNTATFYGGFNVAIWGTFVATVTVERSFDGGTTWVPVAATAGGSALSHTAPTSYSLQEVERDVLYRLNCTAYTSGTVNYRVSQ